MEAGFRRAMPGLICSAFLSDQRYKRIKAFLPAFHPPYPCLLFVSAIDCNLFSQYVFSPPSSQYTSSQYHFTRPSSIKHTPLPHFPSSNPPSTLKRRQILPQQRFLPLPPPNKCASCRLAREEPPSPKGSNSSWKE